MKFKIRQEKGITMVALVVTIIMLLILTNILIYNAEDSIHIRSLTNLYNDIETLRDKVSEYYNEYGKIPANIKYTNITNLSGVLSTNNDTGDFYVIDLEAMQGITLNYGKDYEQIKNDTSNVDNYTDVYIINENSHNIFYVKGINIKEDDITKTYYTDYTEPDETTVDLRYIDGILIPDGYYYIGIHKDSSGNESIVISNVQGEEVDTSKNNQFTWTKYISKLEQKPDSVTLEDNQKEYQFIKSVNTYNGYFKNTEGKVQYVVVDEEKWSETYTKETEYEDTYGNIITIPKGFRVSMSPTMNTVENGFVVKDSNDNEWVWVVVPSSVFTTATSSTDYDNIKADLIAYAADYREGAEGQELNWTDEWYDGCGVKDEKTYTEMYNKMLSSVYTNKGFWISRYEAGIENTNESNSTGRIENTEITDSSQKAVSQKDMIPYNWVTCSEAQILAGKMSTNTDKTSSLMFGLQWDLVCKYIETKGTNPGTTVNSMKEAIKTDSSDWGNYKDISFNISSANAKQSTDNGVTWTAITGEKTASTAILTTGASDRNSIMNIYDFAGNEWEWTLEKSLSSNSPCTLSGGSCYNTNYPASYSAGNDVSHSLYNISFRATLY